jgi:hypothetical protein
MVLFPMDMDFRNSGESPVTTKAEALIHNEFESPRSGTFRCITCWASRLLSSFSFPANHFLLNALGTDAGKAIIEGLASGVCVPDGTAASLGGTLVDLHYLSTPSALHVAASGVTLSGSGTGSGRILVDHCDCNTNADCDDGVFCTGVETCHPEFGCIAVSACPPMFVGCVERNATCDEANHACVDVPHHELCDDGNACDGSEICDVSTGLCLEGTPLDCDDSQFCNGVESCVPNLCCFPAICLPGLSPDDCKDQGGDFLEYRCESGPPPNCNDNVLCTIDSCSAALNRCLNQPNHSVCSDGLYCNGTEKCVAGVGCRPGPRPCPGQCNELTDTCRAGLGSLFRGAGPSMDAKQP